MRTSHLNWHVVLGLLASAFVFFLTIPASASEVSMLSDVQLNGILDNPEIVIVDVRESKGWRSSNIKIKGAVRKIPKRFESWAHDFSTDKTLILY
jgi:hypothetical protein